MDKDLVPVAQAAQNCCSIIGKKKKKKGLVHKASIMEKEWFRIWEEGLGVNLGNEVFFSGNWGLFPKEDHDSLCIWMLKRKGEFKKRIHLLRLKSSCRWAESQTTFGFFLKPEMLKNTDPTKTMNFREVINSTQLRIELFQGTYSTLLFEV